MLNNPRLAVRILQIYVGAAFLIHGIQKMMMGWLQHPDMMVMIISGNLDKVHPLFYREFLSRMVLAHPFLWAPLIAVGETAVGFGLAVGILPRVAAFFGMILMISYWTMRGAPLDPVGLEQAYFFVFLACFLAAESWFVIRRKQGAG